MKLHDFVIATALAALLGCQESNAPAKPISEGAADSNAPRGAPEQPATASVMQGKVVETMNSGGYTYVQLDTGSPGKVWAAGPTTALKVGDDVAFAGGMVMTNFQSKTLNRVFDRIYFVNRFDVGGGSAEAADTTPAPKPSTRAAAAPVEVEKIEKASGGVTVEEIFAQAETLTGKRVKLRGKVVKYNGGILGRNWLHIQDGTGTAGTNDLTVITDGTAAVGDIVVIEGVLAANKDFGAGYAYPLIVEDARIEK